MAQAAKAKKSSVKIDKTYYEGVGRRRTSVARVRVYHAKKAGVTIDDVSFKAGSYIINKKEISKWAQTAADAAILKKPLSVLGDEATFVVYAKVLSGGAKGQRDAIVHGLSRALANIPSGDVRAKLKAEDLLTRDARTRERRKVGTGGKARRLKQSPKR